MSITLDGTNGVTASSFVGPLTGNAATATTAGSTTVLNQVATFPTANGQDFNSLTTGGYYNIIWGNYTGTLNTPSGSSNSYGTLRVENGTNFISQTYMPHSVNTALATRMYYSGTWTAWVYTLNTNNYNSYAAPTSRGFASATITNTSRASATVFQNTNAGHMLVTVVGQNNGAVMYAGATAGGIFQVSRQNATYTAVSCMVPPGWYYRADYSVLNSWIEGQ